MSEKENRALAPFPQWAKNSVQSGDYFKALENYAADHIAYRDTLVKAAKQFTAWNGIPSKENAIILASHSNNTGETGSLNATVSPQEDAALSATAPASEAGDQPEPQTSPPTDMGAAPSQEAQGRVLGKVLLVGDQAMNLYRYVPEAGHYYADTLNEFNKKLKQRLGNQAHLTVLVAPLAVELVESPSLRKLSDSQQTAIREVHNRLDPSITKVDALTALKDHRGEYLYFRSDHHWTARGAFYAYEALMNALGMEPAALSSYPVETVPGFLGSLHSSTLHKKLEQNPDTLELYIPWVKNEYTVHYKGPLPMELLDKSHAGKKNKYRIFLSGDRPWGLIRTESESQRKIAIIKDSYGNALIPFLLPHYQEIYVIDPRQFDQGLLSFLEAKQVSDVLILTNAEVTTYTSFTELIARKIQ